MHSIFVMVRTINKLERGRRVTLESIDTTTSNGKLVFHLFAALAEFERNLIGERTRAGLDAARARGRKGGRPKALDDEKRKLLRLMLDSRGLPDQQLDERMQ